MADAEHIRTTFERNVKAISLRPSVGQGTATTKARIREGLLCDIEDGPWQLQSDLHENQGGESAAPDPGVFGRASLAACLAQAIVLWAARANLQLDDVEVEVHGDYDARGMFGVDGHDAGWTGLSYTVNVVSAAPEAEVRRVVEEAEAHSPLLDDFSKSFEIGREVTIRATGG